MMNFAMPSMAGLSGAPPSSPDPVTLKLGSFAFKETEIPESLNFGGEQALVEHDLIGGSRVVDAMGKRDAPIKWSGLILGPDALARAKTLDAMRASGAAVALSVHSIARRVVVKEFHADFERFYQIPYNITLVVVPDAPKSATPAALSSGAVINADMLAVRAITGQVSAAIGPAADGLAGAVATLQGAMATVSDFAKAAQSTIAGVLAPLAAAQAQVKGLIATVSNTVQSVTTLGGILPNNPIARQAAKLTSQVVAMTQMPKLYALQSTLGRMGAGLGALSSGATTVATVGGNLYQVAAKKLGDATAFAAVMSANKLKDPVLPSAPATLSVPSAASVAGGDGVPNG